MGTLLAFTTVAVSVLIIRYVPPDEVPIPASLLTSVDPLLRHSGDDIEEDRTVSPVDLASYSDNSHLHDKSDVLLEHPLIIKEVTKGNCCLNLLSFLWNEFSINFKMSISSSICYSVNFQCNTYYTYYVCFLNPCPIRAVLFITKTISKKCKSYSYTRNENKTVGCSRMHTAG